MSRTGKVFAISGGVGLLLVIAAAITGIVLVRNGWVEEKVREKIVDSAEKATGGKIELGALHIDWRTWTATVERLVIHGTEPAGAEPLLAVRRVVVGLKIISFLARDVNVQSVEADDPRANLIVLPDGTTNLPKPKTTKPGKSVPETILGLKIAKFDLMNGLVAVERYDRGKSVTSLPAKAWSAHGENLTAHVTYNGAGPRYDGTLSIAPLDFVWKKVHVAPQVALTASMENNKVTVLTATVKLPQSEIDLSNIVVADFTKPVTTGHYTARFSLAEADRIFHLVNFRHTGIVNVAGDARYVSPADYNLTGDVKGAGIGYGKVPDMRVVATVVAAPGNVQVNGLVIDAMGGRMQGNAEIRKLEDIHLTGRLDRFDARQLAALYGGPGDLAKLPYDGIISGPLDLNGKLEESNLHHLVAEAMLAIAPAANSIPVRGAIAAKYNGASNTVELGRSWIELPSTRLDLTGTLGQKLDARFATRDLSDLSPVVDLKTLQATLSPQTGSVTFDGTVTGALADPQIAGRAVVQSANVRGQQIDSLTGDFTAEKTRAMVTNMAVAANNLRARVNGAIDLDEWKPSERSAVTANVQLINADATKLLALAAEKDVPVTGMLNSTAQISGTVGDPHATADLTLTKGEIWGEPYDSITGKAQYVNGGAQVVTAVLVAGRKRLNANFRFDRPDKLTFNVSSNAMAIGQIALAGKYEPTLGGAGQMKADGVVRVDRTKAKTQLEILALNADVRVTGLTFAARNLGDAHLTADTNNGVLTAKIDSDFAKSTIHGQGTVRLTADYPMDAKLTFANLGLNAVAAVARGQKEGLSDLNIDGSAAGDVTLSGPVKKPDAIAAALTVTQLEIHPLTITGAAKNIPNLSLKNNGPLRAMLSRSVIRVDSARFSAPSTDLTLTGAVALNTQAGLDLRAQGNMNLALLEAVDSDLMASGQLALNATVRGSYTNPDVSGRAELQKGEFHLANISNGLTNANGVILFSGARATIQTLSAESGGGKVNVTGFGALTNGRLTFGIDARTRDVRVRYPEGVSSVSDADLNLSGTSERSEVSGTVTVRRVSINPKSDISTVLAAASQPLKTPEGSGNGLLSNVNLDVQIETAPDVAFETNVAQSIQADANLRLRGTVANPAVLGRINITQGEATFFGNKYAISRGSISFFNPAKIDPVLNVDLETKARGVDVVLTVTGPLNKLNMSYRSDPPLQFSDIVGLLATGRTPTDPTLAVRDTGQSQSLTNIGGNALIGAAIANPVAGRLQRFFGVSRIKIDPQLTGITGSPEARLTIEQQVSPELLFTYITDVSSTSTQLIRVEWDFNRRWSAILTREENGYVGLDFAFKKRFK
ncbi:MAG TPA: translocation/assembly module TamB domain-containing protein [Bryobacteraceae bacterium]|nr:translocation/assembly module TamB domain-containing protein [Bryobacteraceae bacterium]